MTAFRFRIGVVLGLGRLALGNFLVCPCNFENQFVQASLVLNEDDVARSLDVADADALTIRPRLEMWVAGNVFEIGLEGTSDAHESGRRESNNEEPRLRIIAAQHTSIKRERWRLAEECVQGNGGDGLECGWLLVSNVEQAALLGIQDRQLRFVTF